MWNFNSWITIATGWLQNRWAERTTWDGVVIIGVCGAYLLLGGLIDWVAYAGVAYGAYTLVTKEQPDA